MGPLYTYATRKNLIASLPVYVVDSYIVGVKAPTPINQGWMNDYSVYSNITNVVICDGVTDIGDDAFRDCSNLTDVSIGNSVTTIGGYAFSTGGEMIIINIDKNEGTISGAPWNNFNIREVSASENYNVKIKWKNAERYYQY